MDTMIDDVFATWMWASGSHTSSFTLYPGGRDTTAQISLSKVSGDSTASAYISETCSQVSSDVIACGVPDGEGESVANYVGNAVSITFELRVDDSFAYAPILLLFHA
jgi:hypothetical protein